MTTTETIPAFQLATIYRVMLKRIAKGYSADQLNFLIGAPSDHIQDIESLQEPFYSINELERISMALEETNPQSLFSTINNEDELQIVVNKEFNQFKIVHTYSRVNWQGQEEALFRLQEDEFQELEDLEKSNETLGIVSDTIDVLIRSGYFYEAKLPYEIFQTINSLRPDPLNPVYIQYALQRFCGDEGDDVKLRITGSSEEPYRYEEC